MRELQRGAEQPEDLLKFIGRTGTALTQLAPRGMIALGEKQFQVVSEDEYLPAQTNIQVLGIASFGELTVRKAKSCE